MSRLNQLNLVSRWSVDTPQKHGGIHRFRQLHEVLDPFSPQVIEWRNVKSVPPFVPPRTIRDRIASRLFRTQPEESPPLDFVRRNHANAERKPISVLKEGLVCVEDPYLLKPLIERWKDEGATIVGLIQNLESLVPTQVAEDQQFQYFEDELRVLRKCELVVTISREETFILNNFGVATLWLPTFPASADIQELTETHQDRLTAEELNGVLMLGTASNPPTRIGMEEVIEYWRGSEIEEQLVIGGFGTDCFEDNCGQRMQVLGALSDDELNQHLKRVRCVIVHQKNGAGALTRIPQLMHSGVPVVASQHAARSCDQHELLFVYQELADIPEILKRVQSLELSHVSPPIREIERYGSHLRNRIRTLAETHGVGQLRCES